MPDPLHLKGIERVAHPLDRGHASGAHVHSLAIIGS